MHQPTVLIFLACLATLAACSQQAEGVSTGATSIPLAQAPSLVPARAPAVPAQYAEGKRVFDKTCGLCHGAGFAGAPRPGDTANWAPRIAKGSGALYLHALTGYSGASGYMPPRGGGDLTDAEVKAGVDYMVAMSSR